MQLIGLLSYVWQHQLNSRGGLRALGRILRWQLASRLLAGPIALQFVEDTRLFASRGMTGATGNWYCGLHEAEEMGFVLHSLRDDDLFLDVGANVGSYTVLAAGAVGARVISVEPIPSTYSHLQMNVLLNGLSGRVELHRMGLSNERSELQFTSGQDTANHVLAECEVGPSVNVPVVRMDELLAGSVPRIIKIDVEGHEKAVLEGGRSTLSNSAVAAVVLEVNGSGVKYGVSDRELLDLMREYGFSPCGYDPVARRLTEWDPRYGNAVFVRDRSQVESLVRQARRYRLVNGTI